VCSKGKPGRALAVCGLASTDTTDGATALTADGRADPSNGTSGNKDSAAFRGGSLNGSDPSTVPSWRPWSGGTATSTPPQLKFRSRNLAPGSSLWDPLNGNPLDGDPLEEANELWDAVKKSATLAAEGCASSEEPLELGDVPGEAIPGPLTATEDGRRSATRAAPPPLPTLPPLPPPVLRATSRCSAGFQDEMDFRDERNSSGIYGGDRGDVRNIPIGGVRTPQPSRFVNKQASEGL
jgi:hypothetical protein